MASPAAVLSILVEANTSVAAGRLHAMEGQLEATGAVVTEFEGKARGMSGSLGRVGGAAERSRGSLRQFARDAAAAAGVFAAFEAGKSAIESTLELGHATERLSAITGLDVKQASTWLETMKVRGVQTRAASMSFITLSRQIRAAGDGSKTARDAFRELGVSADDLARGDTQQVLLDVADGLSEIKSPAERAALAQKLFGRSSQALIPVLAQGKEGVKEALATTQRYGAYLPQNARTLRGAVDAQHDLNLAMDGLKISFTTAVLPSLVQGATLLLGFIGQMRSGKGAGGDFARTVKHAFTIVKGAVTEFTDAVGGIKPALEIAAGAFAARRVLKFASFAREVAGTAKSLGSIPGKLARLTGLKKGVDAAGGGVKPVVAEMTVNTMIVKTMIGGGGGVGGGALSTAEKDAGKVAEGGWVANLLRKLKLIPSTAAEAGAPEAFGARSPGAIPAAVALAVGASIPFVTAAVVREFAKLGGGVPGRVHGPYHGGSFTPDPTGRGRTSLGRAPANAPPVYRLGLGVAPPGRADGASHAAVTQMTKDYEHYNAVLSKLETHRAGVGQTAAALGRLARQAARVGDVKYAFASKLGQEMLRARGAAGRGVTGVVNRLKTLPGRARAQAALAMIQMSQTLEREGRLPKGATARLSREMVVPLRGIGVRARTSAGQVHQLRDAVNRLPAVKDVAINVTINTRFGKVTGRGARGASGERSRGTWTPSATSAQDLARSVFEKIEHPSSRKLTPEHHHAHRAAEKQSRAADKQSRAADRQAAAAGAQQAAADAQSAAAAKAAAAQAAFAAYWARIPSQAVGGQIRMQQLQNQAATAQNAGNTAGQNRATRGELKLEKQWLASDNSQLRKINRALKRRGLSRKQRAALIADKLALLQEIGTIIGNIGETSQALAGGDTGSGGAGGGGGFNLAPGNVPLPTVYDVRRSVAAHGGVVHHHHHNNQRIHVTVSKTGDERKVIEAIDKTLGSHVHARMRAAGMRGT